MCKGSLKDLREKHGVTTNDIIAFVQKTYPRFDKTTLSKCCGEGYGVQLPDEMLKALYEHFAPEAWAQMQKRKAGGNLKRDRITARFTNAEYKALQQAAKDCDTSIQDIVHTTMVSALIANKYLERKELHHE